MIRKKVEDFYHGAHARLSRMYSRSKDGRVFARIDAALFRMYVMIFKH